MVAWPAYGEGSPEDRRQTPDAILDQRIGAIERNLRNVRDDLSAHQKENYDRTRAHAGRRLRRV